MENNNLQYDFTNMKKAVRGKYYNAYRKGHTVKIHHRDGSTTIQADRKREKKYNGNNYLS